MASESAALEQIPLKAVTLQRCAHEASSNSEKCLLLSNYAKVLYQLSRDVRIFASWLPESQHSKAKEALETLQQAIDYVRQRKRMSSLQKVFAKREWDSLVERLKAAHESLKATKRFLQDHFSSSAQVNGNATMPRHTQAVVGMFVPKTDMLLQLVSDLNSNSEESTLVVDLKGRTLRIAEPHTTATLRRSHVVFKNGYMEMALGSRLVIRDEVHDITFSRIAISPALDADADAASKEDARPKGGELHGLLELADANTSVFMKNCELRGGLHCCVAVTGGSVLSLKQCFVSGTSCLLWDGMGEPDPQTGPPRGPCPCDEVASQLQAAADTSGVEAAAETAVQLQGSMWHHGVAVLGRSSMLTAEVCDFHGQGGAGVAVQSGGRAILENTTLHESSGWVGVEVVGAGSDVSLVSCAVRGHAWFGMLAMDGATVSMNKCLLVDNAGGAGVVVHGNASEVVARKCEVGGDVLQLEAGRYMAQ